MCNIVGYAGDKPAVPILIEMLRKSAVFDGGFATGIATIHEGKIYTRKILGSIDDLIEKTDVLSLPGTIGIMHSRPANNLYEYSQPFISPDGSVAIVENGTGSIDAHTPIRNAAVDMLQEKGYYFRSARFADKDGYPQLSTGEYVAIGEAGAYHAHMVMKERGDYEEALIKTMETFYGDYVAVALNVKKPDTISVCRITRPMYMLHEKGESYIATTRFAFPDDYTGESISLPINKVCSITKNALEVSEKNIEGTVPCELTDEMREIAYRKFEKMLIGKKDAPLVYDDVEVELWFKSPELWYEDKPYQRFAELTYDVLYKLHKEGRLKMEVRPQTKKYGTRQCAYMWIDE